jgi:hypothetical protein
VILSVAFLILSVAFLLLSVAFLILSVAFLTLSFCCVLNRLRRLSFDENKISSVSVAFLLRF